MAEATSLNALKKALRGSDNSRVAVGRLQTPFARESEKVPMVDVYTRPASREGEKRAISAKADEMSNFITSISGSIQRELKAYNEVKDEREVHTFTEEYSQRAAKKDGLNKEDKDFLQKTAAGMTVRQQIAAASALSVQEGAVIAARVEKRRQENLAALSRLSPVDYQTTLRSMYSEETQKRMEENPFLSMEGFSTKVGQTLDGYLSGQVNNYNARVNALNESRLVDVTRANLAAAVGTGNLDVIKDSFDTAYNAGSTLFDATELMIDVLKSSDLTLDELDKIANNLTAGTGSLSSTGKWNEQGMNEYRLQIADIEVKRTVAKYNLREQQKNALTSDYFNTTLGSASMVDLLEIVKNPTRAISAAGLGGMMSPSEMKYAAARAIQGRQSANSVMSIEEKEDIAQALVRKLVDPSGKLKEGWETIRSRELLKYDAQTVAFFRERTDYAITGNGLINIPIVKSIAGFQNLQIDSWLLSGIAKQADEIAFQDALIKYTRGEVNDEMRKEFQRPDGTLVPFTSMTRDQAKRWAEINKPAETKTPDPNKAENEQTTHTTSRGRTVKIQ